jgi:aminopeptidase N
VVPNSHGETFARTVLDDASAAAVSAGLCRVDDDLVRAVLWAMQFDRVQTGALGPEEYVDLAARQLPGERSATIVSAVLGRTLGRVLPLRVPTDTASAALSELASACATGLEHAAGVELARAFASGFAATTHEAGPLSDWLVAGSVGELPLSPALRWQVVRRLARLGAMDEEAIRAEGAREPGVESRLGVASALAARPTADAKEQAWAVVADPAVDNRVFSSVMEGLWSAEEADLLAPYVERYLREAPAWAARGQAFAQVVGRARPALMLTSAQVDLLREALAGDVPTVLRRQWEDWYDDLVRAG